MSTKSYKELMSMSHKEWAEKVITKALEDAAFKQQLLSDPKTAVEKLLGKSLGAINLKVVQETANTMYLVLPVHAGSSELSDEELDMVAGGSHEESERYDRNGNCK
jgi:hypothetical protein